jgi:hypothetical protein
MSETSEFRRDDPLQGDDDERRDGVLTDDEGRRPMDSGLTTEQLAEAGASSPAERGAADPRERDAAGMPVAPPDQTRIDETRTDQDRMDQDRMDQDRMDQARSNDWFADNTVAGHGRAGSPSLDSAASAAESDVTARSDAAAGHTDSAQLLAPGDREAMTSRWRDIQAAFVDHPRQAMKDADTLVAGLMQQLAQTFAHERAQLEAQWSRGDEVSTEDLRVSLQRYRAFFERLLSV